ncbi:jerky protein homolog-like [Bacillus rossius redtenbacheri]|uniref:jerky protein homolog-like n=1 Tax=Bacillus rossius redtenbacheri TaxID=93214 RepID=UPI002FDE4C27
MLPRKRKVLTVDEKVSLVKAIENGEKQTDVVRRTGLSQSTVATIWKDRRKWLDADVHGDKKKMRKPQYEDLDRAILQWFQQQRINNIPLSGPLIKMKAEFYATELGIPDFKASEGWLSKWKQRHNINYGQINGEARDVDRNTTDGWLEKHAGWLKDPEPADDEDDLPLAVWVQQLELPTTFSEEELLDFENIDGQVATAAGVTDEDILNSVRVDEDSDQENIDPEEEPEPEPVPTPKEALEAAKVLRRFFTHQDDPVATEDVGRLEDKVRSLLWKTKKRQTTLKDFFQ